MTKKKDIITQWAKGFDASQITGFVVYVDGVGISFPKSNDFQGEFLFLDTEVKPDGLGATTETPAPASSN